jgi:protein-S-isoprenylcysteine O-methyltransferase Ste14
MHFPGLIDNTVFWVAFYTLGLAIILAVLGLRRLHARVALRVPKPVMVPFIVLFMIVPPLALPFAEGPSIGLPRAAGPIVGGLLFAANIVIKVAGQRRIGAMPALKAGGALVTDGVYGRVRHPLYLSNILMALGMALLADSRYALFFSIYYAAGFVLIIHFEERELIDRCGETYRHYRRKVPQRLIPKVY